MALRRIAHSSLASLRPAGRAADRDYHALTGYLADAGAFGPQFAEMFAEPVYVKGGETIDWYWEVGPVAPVPVNSLPERDRDRVLALAEAKLRAVREEGERLGARGDGMSHALLAAATVPEPLADHLQWVAQPGSPDGGTAIVIDWGFIREDATLPDGAIEGTRERLDQPPPVARQDLDMPERALRDPAGAQGQTVPPQHAGSAGATTWATVDPEMMRPTAAGGVLLVHDTAYWLRWLLWPLLLLLLILIAALLLRSCGIGLPFFPGSVLFSYCGGGPLTMIEQDRTQTLRSAIADLELRLAQREAQCLAQLPPSSRPGAAPSPPGPGPSEEEIKRRREREGAEKGEIQLSLAWDGPADLDLSVVCPGGETIGFRSKQACGGTLDVDMNSQERQSQTPVEHIVWPAGATMAAGNYEVRVTLFDVKGDSRPAIPFVVELKLGGATKRFDGTVAPPGKTPRTVTTFTR
jgi:hypothetical protein